MSNTEQWIAHDYSVIFILQKLLRCSSTNRGFRYLRDMINRSVARPVDSYREIFRWMSNRHGVSVNHIQRHIRIRLWLSMLFNEIDIEFLSIIEGDNAIDMPIWKKRTNAEYLISIIADYRSVRQSRTRRYWKCH